MCVCVLVNKYVWGGIDCGVCAPVCKNWLRDMCVCVCVLCVCLYMCMGKGDLVA